MKNVFALQHPERTRQLDGFLDLIKNKSDRLINYFLISYFLGGLLLAFFYDTWMVAIGVGGLALIAYYSAKILLPDSNLYQYVLSAVLGVFMAQYIYQMHGLFEMHFVAFIGSAMLITYQNWKLQIPIILIVAIHHGVFGYLQYLNFDQVYFTQLEYMDLQTFIIHILLAVAIFFMCGLWAHHFKKYSERHIAQSFEIGRLQVAEAQKEELQKSNTELDRFVYSVSHDLRAPLCSMLGVIEITEEMTEDSLTLKHFGMLKTSIGKMDGFIGDILHYSRNSRLEVKSEEINFKEILTDITNNLKYMAPTHRAVDIDIEVNNEKLFFSDKRRINVVLNNLIANSIRYQNPKTENPYVKVEVKNTESGVSILVKDNGIGISKEFHPKIYDMFYRVSEVSEGSGLGLYIVKEMIHKLEGAIDFDSELGTGTTFSLRIPQQRATA
ncbi:MAG TPA: HAMP domain-containing sensor histidine kinase [Chitinophagales bacterium]|nr:HAMP domain-containing sensor histidine kinase [Chitinophagales bacterium]